MNGVVTALLVLCAACAPVWKDAPHDRRFQRTPAPTLHARPVVEDGFSDWWDQALNAGVLPLARLVSPARYIDAATEPRPALDVNDFGEVPDSPWFENRIGRYPLRPEEVAAPWGPGPSQGPLTVISGKLEGVTPGVVVRDRAGVVWFVKFDPPAFAEMSTGAEAIAARFLHAAGYRVPENHLIELSLDRLELDPDARTRDEYNRSVPLDKDRLEGLLKNLNPDVYGELRALMIRAVPGEPLGPFSYRGVRVDDPNDLIPHERRRSLRALWVLCAWLNNTDTRRQNTLDTFRVVDEEQGLGFVEHYLIDFGDALGAAGDRSKYVYEGYEAVVDWKAIGARLFGIGLRYPYWLPVYRTSYRAVGVFEAEIFSPESWSPAFDNPAFREATTLDTFWGAALLVEFDRDIVEAVVAEGRYSEPGAAETIVNLLMERREKLLRYAFREVAPLAHPRIEQSYALSLRDLSAEAGLTDPGPYAYRVRWNRSSAVDIELATGTVREPRIDTREIVRRLLEEHRDAFVADPYLTVELWARRDRRGPRVEVHLRAAGAEVFPVGLYREVSMLP